MTRPDYITNIIDEVSKIIPQSAADLAGYVYQLESELAAIRAKTPDIENIIIALNACILKTAVADGGIIAGLSHEKASTLLGEFIQPYKEKIAELEAAIASASPASEDNGLRDMFAAQAMNGWIAEQGDFAIIAELAYRTADAMMKARSK